MNSSQDFIQLSTDTAPAARGALPIFPPPPRARLPRGATAAALRGFQDHALSRVDAHTNAAQARCASIAAFAEAVCAIDADLGAALEGVGDV